MEKVKSSTMMDWQKLPISLAELCLSTTLRCGQSFRWKKSGKDEWSCALHGRILTLRQDKQHLHYRAAYGHSKARVRPKVKAEKPTQPQLVLPPTPPRSSPASLSDAEPEGKPFIKSEKDDDGDGIVKDVNDIPDTTDDTSDLVQHYLNLTPNLESLYEQWSSADANFKRRAPRFTGVRILRQDAWEALVGFICSSNNNIVRISQMVDKLCKHYGSLVGYLEHEYENEADGDHKNAVTAKGRAANATPYYDFPLPEVLARPGVEQHLRELGFGYRAKYLYQTAVMVEEKGLDWLDGLRNPESPAFVYRHGDEKKLSSHEEMPDSGREGYRRAHESLLALQGVGPKVADCVCLMGLGWGEAVPVDTHVWQIAQRDYRFGKSKHSSLTKATYDAIGAKFRRLWGKEAGWAHSVLFAADLRAFADRVVAKVESPDSGGDDDKGVKMEVEVKVESTDGDGAEDVGIGSGVGVGTVDRVSGTLPLIGRREGSSSGSSVKREYDLVYDVKGEEKVEEVSSARSLRAKRRRTG